MDTCLMHSKSDSEGLHWKKYWIRQITLSFKTFIKRWRP
jgi:hypothetical protein